MQLYLRDAPLAAPKPLLPVRFEQPYDHVLRMAKPPEPKVNLHVGVGVGTKLQCGQNIFGSETTSSQVHGTLITLTLGPQVHKFMAR